MKHRVLLIAAIMMALMIPKVVGAYSFSAVAPTGQTLYYNISGSNVSVTYPGSPSNPLYSNPYSGYTQPSGALTIPSSVTHNGYTYTVTSIGNFAFRSCLNLTSVTMPNTITQIGDYAFNTCIGLTSATIPDSVTYIGERAFYSCSGLTSVTIPNSVTSIGVQAFTCCKGLTSIVVASDNIYYDSRDNCNAIIETSTNSLIAGCQTTVIPISVASISDDAFFNCSGLTSVTIPDSVIFIGNYAFYDCSGLTSVTIPNTVTSIGINAFHLVKHIEYHGSATGSPWGAISMNGYTEGDFVYSDSTRTHLLVYIGTDSIVAIPNSVTSIGTGAFYNCSGLTSVSIPNSVTSIGDSAFLNCSVLTSVTIPSSVISIGNYAFAYCSGLISITIPNSVTSIGSRAFSSCRGLSSVTIPNSVTSIGNYAFYDCRGLTWVTISNSVTSIGEYTFGDCRGLTSVTIPNSVTSIGNYAFAYCNNLTSATISNSVTSIGSRAFFNCSVLTEVTIRSEAAPTLGSQSFDANDSSRIFNIPCGSYNSYYNGSGWASYRSALHEQVVFELLINTNDSTKGVASIVQQIGYDNPCDSSAIIIATASYGYHFDHWSNGNIANPDTLYLVSDSTVTAIFVANQYVLTVQSADESLGSVTGSGTYEYLDTATITASSTAEHYHFVQWNDGYIDNPRQVVITCDTAFAATFAIDTHMVTVVVGDTTRGFVSGDGEYAYGATCVLTAYAFEDYTFAGWSNGVATNPYTFAVKNDVELTAIFTAPGEEAYTVTVESADTTMGSATVNGNTTTTVMSGETVTLTATANTGYHFARWSDNNTEATHTVTVTADMNFIAYFESDSTEGIEDVGGQSLSFRVYAVEGRIVVEGAEGETVRVYDVMGRMVTCSSGTYAPALTGTPSNFEGEFRVPTSGVYLVKVGQHPARKVVVIR